MEESTQDDWRKIGSEFMPVRAPVARPADSPT
jgi:hypothetical protein